LLKVLVEHFLAAAVDAAKMLPQTLVSLGCYRAIREQLCCASPMMDVVAVNTDHLDPQKHRDRHPLLLAIVPNLMTVTPLCRATNAATCAIRFDQLAA
jgi:hypothetical protein